LQKENHGEARSSRQCNDQRTDQTAFFLALVITDFIRNTKGDLYDKKLEDALEMLDLQWNKDEETRTQCNRLNSGPLHQGIAFNANGPARVRRRMQWEEPSKPLAVDDPPLLPEREVLVEKDGGCSGKHLPNVVLRSRHTVTSKKRVFQNPSAESLIWEERLGQARIRTTEGLTTGMEPHRGSSFLAKVWQTIGTSAINADASHSRWRPAP